jgi:RNA polymerase sigma factor (sigma-70 family)
VLERHCSQVVPNFGNGAALTALESLSERPARVVELRFFGGLSVEETAAVMNMSERAVKREWQKARAFLFDALRREGFR